MKAKEMMDKEFVFVSKNDSIEDVSIKMEEYRRFTAPVLDENMKLEGWITSFNITQGLREGKKIIADVMSPVEEIMTINENEAARNVVIAASKNKLISIPIINDENQVIGVCRSVDVVDSMSSLYDIKVVKIYEAMEKEIFSVYRNARDQAKKVNSNRKVSDDDYLNAAKAMSEVKYKVGEIETRYFNQFAKILSKKQLFILKKAEVKFTRDVVGKKKK